jgi:hypothetical protein
MKRKKKTNKWEYPPPPSTQWFLITLLCSKEGHYVCNWNNTKEKPVPNNIDYWLTENKRFVNLHAQTVKRAYNCTTGFPFYIRRKEHICNTKNKTSHFGYATCILNNYHTTVKQNISLKNKFWKELLIYFLSYKMDCIEIMSAWSHRESSSLRGMASQTEI